MKKIWATLISLFSVILMIVVWDYVAFRLDASVIVPAPFEVFMTLKELFVSRSFLSDVGATVLRALESFAVIVILGAVSGMLAGLFKPLEMVFRPFVTLFKATPVMSVVLIAFLWFRTGQIPVFSAFLMAFPVMYVQTLDGMKHRSPELDQMCRIYGIKGKRKLVNVTVGEMMPALITGSKQSLSMIWKVVIAAEVLTLPEYGIGRSLHVAQIQIETAMVFAWTVIAILLTFASDALFAIILKRAVKRGFK